MKLILSEDRDESEQGPLSPMVLLYIIVLHIFALFLSVTWKIFSLSNSTVYMFLKP